MKPPATFAALAAVLLLGCVGPRSVEQRVECVSPCGIILMGPIPEPSLGNIGQPSWTCPELVRAESVITQAFATYVKDPRFASGAACEALRGWKIWINPEPVWASADFATARNPEGLLAGITFCDSGFSIIGNLPPLDSSLAHELAHVVQRCVPLGPGLEGGHANWGRDGIQNAIDAVNVLALLDRAACFDGGFYVGPLDGGVCSK